MKFKKWAVILFASFTLTMGCSDDDDVATEVPKDPENTTRPPNYITLLVDDMGFSDIGINGGEISTPNIDQLASEGIILDEFYAAPTSTPSRGMLFTGKDNHQSGVGNMAGWIADREEQIGQPGYEGVLSLEALPISEVLQGNGYETMIVGKWDLGEEPEYYPSNRGFDKTFVLLPGGDTHYLSDENGNVLSSQPPAAYARLGRESLYNENGQEFKDFPPYAYSSTYYTDKAIGMLDTRDKNKPFSLHVCYIAPHAPFQAPQEVTEKYIDVYYAKGWDVIRQERFARLKELGVIPQDAVQPPRPDSVTAWNDLSEDERRIEAKRMAVYAAMIEVLDDNIGRLVKHLREIGEYDNTVIFFMSDNGAAFLEAGSPAKQQYVSENFTGLENYENMGGPTSFISANEGWAMASNVPFTRYKGDTYEGGIHTAAFVHYPQSKVSGVKTDRLTSIMDIGATMVDMADIQYPDTYKDKANIPLQGVSMAALFDGELSADPTRWIAWELDGLKGLRLGDWALSQKWNDETSCWDENWNLYNLANDPFETTNLAETEPEKLQELQSLYDTYAEENGVIEVGPCPYGDEDRVS